MMSRAEMSARAFVTVCESAAKELDLLAKVCHDNEDLAMARTYEREARVERRIATHMQSVVDDFEKDRGDQNGGYAGTLQVWRADER